MPKPKVGFILLLSPLFKMIYSRRFSVTFVMALVFCQRLAWVTP